MTFTLDDKLKSELQKKFLTPVDGECNLFDTITRLIPGHISDPKADKAMNETIKSIGSTGETLTFEPVYEHVNEEMLHCLMKSLKTAKTLIEGGTIGTTTLEPTVERQLEKARTILLMMSEHHAAQFAGFAHRARESSASKIARKMHEEIKHRPLESQGEKFLEWEIEMQKHNVQSTLAGMQLDEINACWSAIEVLEKLQGAIKTYHKANGHNTAEPGGNAL